LIDNNKWPGTTRQKKKHQMEKNEMEDLWGGIGLRPDSAVVAEDDGGAAAVRRWSGRRCRTAGARPRRPATTWRLGPCDFLAGPGLWLVDSQSPTRRCRLLSFLCAFYLCRYAVTTRGPMDSVPFPHVRASRVP